MNYVFAIEAKEKLKTMTEAKKNKMQSGKKIYIGHEKREGWLGELPFYIFWCESCGNYAKDYPHGHIEFQYLKCSYCDMLHDFVPWWFFWKVLWDTIKFSLINRPRL